MSASVFLLPSQSFLLNLGIFSLIEAQETNKNEKAIIVIIFFIWQHIEILFIKSSFYSHLG